MENWWFRSKNFYRRFKKQSWWRIVNQGYRKFIINSKYKLLLFRGFNLTLFKEFNILGSINFYEADVKVYNTNFENIYSEDAINIFRSNLEIYKNSYKNVESDAIDIDFSKVKSNQVNLKILKMMQ